MTSDALVRGVARMATCVFTSLILFTTLRLLAGAPQSQAPVFKSKVEIVQLDVSVLDKHRQPVRGLTEKDFAAIFQVLAQMSGVQA